ncbi:MAG: guanylate kinase [Acidobacteriota bacterium]
MSNDASDVFILSAPSGAGKSTLIQALYRDHAEVTAGLGFSVSHNTRPPRESEVDGRHYHFVDEAAFRGLVDDGAFLEWAEVHGQLKGTSLAEVERLRREGLDLLLEIDVQGAEQVRARLPEAVSIFVLPPSFRELEQRLRGRGSEGEEQLRRRLTDAEAELRRAEEFDYVIVNDDATLAADALATILRARRFRRARMQPQINRLFATLPPAKG